jgi:hypothetical protein
MSTDEDFTLDCGCEWLHLAAGGALVLACGESHRVAFETFIAAVKVEKPTIRRDGGWSYVYYHGHIVASFKSHEHAVEWASTIRGKS